MTTLTNADLLLQSLSNLSIEALGNLDSTTETTYVPADFTADSNFTKNNYHDGFAIDEGFNYASLARVRSWIGRYRTDRETDETCSGSSSYHFMRMRKYAAAYNQPIYKNEAKTELYTALTYSKAYGISLPLALSWSGKKHNKKNAMDA